MPDLSTPRAAPGSADQPIGLTIRDDAPIWRLPAAPIPPTGWQFPDPDSADESGLVGTGADLEPGTVLSAYSRGLFPMDVTIRGRRRLGWWSPDPRGVVPLDGLVVSKSLRRSAQRFEIRVDTAFDEVIDGCGDEHRDGRWITPEVHDAYVRLHDLGWVHSVEAWTPEGELVGGLYGVAVGALFAGESMFHRRTDASKVALLGLVERLTRWGYRLLDVQWKTPHLATLGAIEIPRARYLRSLAEALAAAPPGPAREPGET